MSVTTKQSIHLLIVAHDYNFLNTVVFTGFCQGDVRSTPKFFTSTLWYWHSDTKLKGVQSLGGVILTTRRMELLTRHPPFSGTKCLKNQQCDVIKMREMRWEVGKKTLKKETSHVWFFIDFLHLSINHLVCPSVRQSVTLWGKWDLLCNYESYISYFFFNIPIITARAHLSI